MANNNSLLPQGALLLFNQFQPKHRLTIQDVCSVIGLSRDGFYKRLRTGKLSLKIRQDECGKKWILLADLISYLFPEISDSLTALPSGLPSGLPPPLPLLEKKKRGRPFGSGNKQKTPTAQAQEGGAQ